MMDDIEAWAFEKHVLYSVPSYYIMLKHESDQMEDFGGRNQVQQTINFVVGRKFTS
jgi:hypothetical protein